MFKVGSRVCLTNTALRKSAGIGTVLHVISTDGGPSDFVYDVKFASVRRTLRGSELIPVRTGRVSASFSCEEKTSLWIAHQKALNASMKALRTLADAAGTVAKVKFEFLKKRVDYLEQRVEIARQRLDEHVAKHRC